MQNKSKSRKQILQHHNGVEQQPGAVRLFLDFIHKDSVLQQRMPTLICTKVGPSHAFVTLNIREIIVVVLNAESMTYV